MGCILDRYRGTQKTEGLLLNYLSCGYLICSFGAKEYAHNYRPIIDHLSSIGLKFQTARKTIKLGHIYFRLHFPQKTEALQVTSKTAT